MCPTDLLHLLTMGHIFQSNLIHSTIGNSAFALQNHTAMGNTYTNSQSGTSTFNDHLVGKTDFCNGFYTGLDTSFSPRSDPQPTTTMTMNNDDNNNNNNMAPFWVPQMTPDSLMSLLRPFLLSQLCETTANQTENCFPPMAKMTDNVSAPVSTPRSTAPLLHFNDVNGASGMKHALDVSSPDGPLVKGLEQIRDSLEQRGLLLSSILTSSNSTELDHSITNGSTPPSNRKSSLTTGNTLDPARTLLIAGQVCDWPGCEAHINMDGSFSEHLNTVHRLSLQSLAQVEVCASRLELYLRAARKESQRLNAMLRHLFNQTSSNSTDNNVTTPSATTPPTDGSQSNMDGEHLTGHKLVVDAPIARSRGPTKSHLRSFGERNGSASSLILDSAVAQFPSPTSVAESVLLCNHANARDSAISARTHDIFTTTCSSQMQHCTSPTSTINSLYNPQNNGYSMLHSRNNTSPSKSSPTSNSTCSAHDIKPLELLTNQEMMDSSSCSSSAVGQQHELPLPLHHRRSALHSLSAAAMAVAVAATSSSTSSTPGTRWPSTAQQLGDAAVTSSLLNRTPPPLFSSPIDQTGLMKEHEHVQPTSSACQVALIASAAAALLSTVSGQRDVTNVGGFLSGNGSPAHSRNSSMEPGLANTTTTMSTSWLSKAAEQATAAAASSSIASPPTTVRFFDVDRAHWRRGDGRRREERNQSFGSGFPTNFATMDMEHVNGSQRLNEPLSVSVFPSREGLGKNRGETHCATVCHTKTSPTPHSPSQYPYPLQWTQTPLSVTVEVPITCIPPPLSLPWRDLDRPRHPQPLATTAPSLSVSSIDRTAHDHASPMPLSYDKPYWSLQANSSPFLPSMYGCNENLPISDRMKPLGRRWFPQNGSKGGMSKTQAHGRSTTASASEPEPTTPQPTPPTPSAISAASSSSVSSLSSTASPTESNLSLHENSHSHNNHSQRSSSPSSPNSSTILGTMYTSPPLPHRPSLMVRIKAPSMQPPSSASLSIRQRDNILSAFSTPSNSTPSQSSPLLSALLLPITTQASDMTAVVNNTTTTTTMARGSEDGNGVGRRIGVKLSMNHDLENTVVKEEEEEESSLEMTEDADHGSNQNISQARDRMTEFLHHLPADPSLHPSTPGLHLAPAPPSYPQTAALS